FTSFNVLFQMVPKNYKIHCHCFTGDYTGATRWIEAFPRLFIGLTPMVTYRQCVQTHNVARYIPLNKLLLETDAPYFLPRKIPKEEMALSHPGMAITVAERVAFFQQCTVQKVLQACRNNMREMYGI
ncbi:putative deoxyribonuclease TATDN2, partial [Saccostrea cucullata]|uniref:putative deoxyribonuclease TATDN2 n=1 Tax=Saccostrea cuccullata TaxID=36930 RepID=UPI002ED14D6A